MRVAYEVCRANAKYPGSVKLTDFKLKFGGQPERLSTEQQKWATNISKAFWIQRVTTDRELEIRTLRRDSTVEYTDRDWEYSSNG